MWDRIVDWDLVLPPSRPDVPDLRRIAKLARGLEKDAPVAVLGSTPEFRDLLCDWGFTRVSVIDKDKSFHARMNKLRVGRNVEAFVHSDWLEGLDNHKNHFSLILSDLTSGNVPYKQRTHFYASIRSSLTHGGWFVDKVLTNEAPLWRLDDLRARYIDRPLNLLSANYFSCEAIFCSELQIQSGVIETSKIYATLREFLRGKRFDALLTLAQRITPTGCIWFYGKPWLQLRRTYCHSLTARRSFDMPAGSPYHGRARQFFWQRS